MEKVSEFRFEKIRRRKNGTFLRVDLHLESQFVEDLRTCLDRNVYVVLVDEGDRKYPIHTKVHTLFFRGEDRAVLMFKVPYSELSFKQISVSVHLGFKDGRIRSTERSTSLGMYDKSIREIVESVMKKRSRILMIRPNHCRVSSPVSCEIVYYLDDDDEERKFKNKHHIERISFGGRTSKEQSKEIQIGFSKDDHRVHLWKKKYPQSCRNVSGRGHSEFIVRPIIPPKGEKPGWVDVELVVNGTILILKKGFFYHADDDEEEEGEEVETESRKDVIKSVRRDGMSLKNVPEKYRNDRNVVELAVKQNGNALEFASGELQNDSEVVLAAIRQNWSSFKFASEELLEDKSFVLDIVSENGFALAKLPERFRKDKGVVMRAVSKNSEAIKFSSKEMREDKDVVREAVRNCWDRALEKVWAECGNGLKQDESFIMELLSLNGMLLKHLPKKMNSDKNFLCPALEQNIDIRLYVPETKSFYSDPKVRDDDVFHSSIVGFTKKLQKMFRRMNDFDSRIGGTRHSKKLVSRVYGELIRCLSERAELHHKLGNYEECIDDLFLHYQLQEKISRTMDVKLGDAILKINRAWILKAKETLDQSFYDLTSEEIRQVVENFDWVGMIGGELEEKINMGWPDYESEELLKIVEMEVRKHPEILKVRKNMEQMIPKFFYLKKQRKKKEKLSEQISPPLKEQDNRIEFLKRKKKVERIIESTIKIFNERLKKALDEVMNVLLDYNGLKSKNGRKNFGPYFSLSRQKNLLYFGFVHPETRRRYGYGVEYTQCVLNDRTPSLKSKIMSYWGIGGRSKRKKSVGGGGTIHNYYNSTKTPTTQAVRNYECTFFKLFYGRYVDGYRTGKGSEFGLLDRRTNKIVTSNETQRRKLCTKESIKKNQGLELIPIFKGKYYLGKRHGRGELYNNNNENNQNRETRYGEWVDNELVHEYEDDGGTLKRDEDVPYVHLSVIEDYISSSGKEKLLVGKGANGDVYRIPYDLIKNNCSHDQPNENIGEFVAVKIIKQEIRRRNRHMYHIFVERLLLRGIMLSTRRVQDKSHVLQTFGLVVDDHTNLVVGCIMKLCEKSVGKFIKENNNQKNPVVNMPKYNNNNIPPLIEEKRRILLETAKGMKSLHASRLMHLDLKPGNVLMESDGTIKITDFDSLEDDRGDFMVERSQESSFGDPPTVVGTTFYIAPEAFKDKEYTLKCDVYSFGIMVYSLLWGFINPYRNYKIHKLPCQSSLCGRTEIDEIFQFNSRSQNQYNYIERHVFECDLRPLLLTSETEKFPKHMIDLMVRCWNKNPFLRPEFEEIVQRISEGEDYKPNIDENYFLEPSSTSGLCFVSVQFVFRGRDLGIDRMLMTKPYTISKIRKWLEPRLLPQRGKNIRDRTFGIEDYAWSCLRLKERTKESKEKEEEEEINILSFSHPQFGEIHSNDRLEKLIRMESSKDNQIELHVNYFILYLSTEEEEEEEDEGEEEGEEYNLNLRKRIREQVDMKKRNRDFTIRQRIHKFNNMHDLEDGEDALMNKIELLCLDEVMTHEEYEALADRFETKKREEEEDEGEIEEEEEYVVVY